VTVLPVDVNASLWDCTLEAADGPSRPLALRLGFRMLKGFAERHAERIIAARQQAPFESMADFTARTGLGQGAIAQLAEADAFASLSRDRRAALWEALAQERSPQDRPLLAIQDQDEPLVPLPSLTLREQILADYQTSGLSLKAHPISLYRRQLQQLRVVPARSLQTYPNNRQVRVAGLIILRQRPGTARGITFVSLEDDTGVANLVVRQEVWERRRGQVIHVIVNRLEDLAKLIGDWNTQSRDFR
jgi:error-prone DNA polymerase